MEGIIVMCAVSYFSIKAMLLIIDCKYKVLNVVFHYEEITSDIKEDHDSQTASGKHWPKSANKVSSAMPIALKNAEKNIPKLQF